jgi:UDP-GlcNAc3NAcA epimerase
MLDAFLHYRKSIEAGLSQERTRLPELFGNGDAPTDFYLATTHRAENTDDPVRLRNIIDGLNSSRRTVVFPIHPRTRRRMAEWDLRLGPRIRPLGPVGYLEMLELQMRCSAVVTDSGGMQKEAYFLKKPCITLRDQTEWVETVESGWNRLVGADAEAIRRALVRPAANGSWPPHYGSGRAGEAILKCLAK